MVFDTAAKGRDLLAEILRHIDAVIYPDPQTGLYTVKLCRDDYDVNDLPVFDASNMAPGSFEFSRISWEDTINTTFVNYTDRYADFTSLPVEYKDPANIFVRKGQMAVETLDFQGFSRPEPANDAAARMNKTRSSPLCRVAFSTDRSGYSLRPGSVIVVRRPDYGITELIIRVIDMNYGTLDDPAVKVVGTEDIFAVNALAYDPPEGSDFTPPSGQPTTLLDQLLMEVPHFGAPDDRPYIFTFATRAGAFDLQYQTWSDPLGGTDYVQTNTSTDFTPSGLLTAAYAIDGLEIDEDGFTVSSLTDQSRIVPGPAADRDDGMNLVLINNEIMAWREMVDNGDSTFTFKGVYRAVLDTVPDAHAMGDRVWFFTEGADLVDPDGYSGNVSVRAKLLTSNTKQVLPIGGATAMTLTTDSRSLRPLPPGKVRVNGARPYDLVATVAGAFSASWSARNRNDDTIRAQSADSVVPETGTTYNLRFYRVSAGTLIIEKTGITALSASVALAYTGDVRMELEAVRGGLASWQTHSYAFDYDADGTVTSVITADDDVYVLDGGAP
jgi:hypothetical protein